MGKYFGETGSRTWSQKTLFYGNEILMQQHRVHQSIIMGPVSPFVAMYQGDSADEVVATTASAGIQTWVALQLFGGAASMGDVAHARKFVAWRMAIAGLTLAAPVATAAGVTSVYIGQMEKHAPEDPAQSSSFWRSISAAMSGTIGGVDVVNR